MAESLLAPKGRAALLRLTAGVDSRFQEGLPHDSFRKVYGYGALGARVLGADVKFGRIPG